MSVSRSMRSRPLFFALFVATFWLIGSHSMLEAAPLTTQLTLTADQPTAGVAIQQQGQTIVYHVTANRATLNTADLTAQLNQNRAVFITNPTGHIHITADLLPQAISHGRLYFQAAGSITTAPQITLATPQIKLAANTINLQATFIAQQSSGHGGNITLTAENISLTDTALLDASGLSGGKVLVIARHKLDSHGRVSAAGTAGDGGFVELSGHNQIQLTNWASQVDLSAPNGRNGTLLIDPTDITIQGGSVGMIGGSPVTANTLGAGDITTYLNNNGNLIISTASGGPDNGDITVNAGVNINWTSGNSLTLQADNEINMNPGSSITATSGDIIFNANFAISLTTLSTGGNVQLSAGFGEPGYISDTGDTGTDVTAALVTINGILSPRSEAIGTFSIAGNLTFQDNSVFEPDISGSTTGGPHDQLTVSGNVTIGNSVTLDIFIVPGYVHQAGSITIISNGGTTTGTFFNLPEGAQTDPGQTNNFIISYSSVVLTAATPSAVTLQEINTTPAFNTTFYAILIFVTLLTGIVLINRPKLAQAS